jgi:hypothetical protein
MDWTLLRCVVLNAGANWGRSGPLLFSLPIVAQKAEAGVSTHVGD